MPELFTAVEWQTVATHLRLTSRQSDVARLMCRGLQRKEIATELGLSSATVRMHMEALFKKLRVRDKVGVLLRVVHAERALRAETTKRPRHGQMSVLNSTSDLPT